jgi:hypothetical protein
VVPAPSRSQLRGIEPWSSLPNFSLLLFLTRKDVINFYWFYWIICNIQHHANIYLIPSLFFITVNCNQLLVKRRLSTKKKLN